jgi:uncharacterized protein (TIGR02246 family)
MPSPDISAAADSRDPDRRRFLWRSAAASRFVQTATCLVAAVAIILSGCNQAPTGPVDRRGADARTIRDLETGWNRDFTRSDVERLLSRYTDGAVLLVPNSAPATGKEAIRDALKQVVQDGNFSLKLENSNVEVSRDGDLAYSQGMYETTFTDPATSRQVQDHGSYVIVYRRQADGLWKAAADIRTSSVPLGR